MILVVVAMTMVWMGLRRRSTSSIVILAAIGLATASLVTVGGSLFVTEIPTGSQQVLRVFGPAAFPFTIQQHRDYAAGTYHYAIVIGYPGGISVVESSEEADQAEFIHIDHLLFTAYLGALNLIALAITLAALVLLKKKAARSETVPARSAYLGVTAIIAAALLVQAVFLALIQASLHLVAAAITFVATMLLLFIGLSKGI